VQLIKPATVACAVSLHPVLDVVLITLYLRLHISSAWLLVADALL
jgi:hypothetical protein